MVLIDGFPMCLYQRYIYAHVYHFICQLDNMTYVICYGVVMGLYVLLYSFFLFTQDVSGLLRSSCLSREFSNEK